MTGFEYADPFSYCALIRSLDPGLNCHTKAQIVHFSRAAGRLQGDPQVPYVVIKRKYERKSSAWGCYLLMYCAEVFPWIPQNTAYILQRLCPCVGVNSSSSSGWNRHVLLIRFALGFGTEKHAGVDGRELDQCQVMIVWHGNGDTDGIQAFKKRSSCISSHLARPWFKSGEHHICVRFNCGLGDQPVT